MLLIALSVLPVVVLLIYIYIKDRYQKEPFKLLMAALGMGMLLIIPAILVEMSLMAVCPFEGRGESLYTSFVVAGCTEEALKLLFLYWLIWRNRHFDEYFDGIVYAVFVSLGFALVENVLYVLSGGIEVGFARALFSVPGHFLFAVVMGYFFALAKFSGNKRRNMFLAFFVPMILHGIFDALLLLADASANVSESDQGVLLIAFIIFDIVIWVIGKRKIKELQGY